MVIVILAVVVIGAAVAGNLLSNSALIINPELQKSYAETRCATSIFFDDLINGNYTKDKSQYFVGIKPLKFDLAPNLTSTT